MTNRLMAGLGLIVSSLTAPAAIADIRITELRMQRQDDQWTMVAHIDYDLPRAVTEALENGVTLHLNTDIELIHHRRWWQDKVLYTIRRDRHLQYHAISKKYLLLVPEGEPSQVQFHSLSHALQNMGHMRQHIPNVAMGKDGDYRLRLRTWLNTLSLPHSLQLVAQTSQTWRKLAIPAVRELTLP